MGNATRAWKSPESVDRRIASFAARRYSVFSRAQALSFGATKSFIQSRLGRGLWERLHPGVYRLAGASSSWRQRVFAACLAAGEPAGASHRSAATLLRLPSVDSGIVELTVPRGRRFRCNDIVAHESRFVSSIDFQIVDGIPITTPTRTLIDLAAVVEATALEEALDDALRRTLTSIPRLRWRLRELGKEGRAGTRVIHELLEARSGPVPRSVFETRLLRLLTHAGLPGPVRQHPVRDRGRVVGVVDFAYPDLKLVIEADGYRWHSSRARWEHDLARRNALTALGWRVIHATWNELEHHPDRVTAMIERELGERSR